MPELLGTLGPWNWFILAAVLFVLEMLAPGMFMVWVGLAAVVIGIVSAAVTLSWQLQLIGFAVLAIGLVPAWRHLAGRAERPADNPFLNRRTEGYVGRVFTLEKPIIDGVGGVRIGDTIWQVTGPDCPAGSRVKVAAAEGPKLAVKPEAEVR